VVAFFVPGGGGCSGLSEVVPAFLRKKPLTIPEPRQKVRLRARRRLWRGNFRALSYPYADEAGETLFIRVTEEGEYQKAIREGRRAVGMPWPVRQVEVVPFPEDDKKTQELPQRSHHEQEKAEPRSWWRRMFRS
jgi:hypothetical protein